ncbi:hypothetical protein ACFQX6_13185 [Streptosporangium lutulentum]
MVTLQADNARLQAELTAARQHNATLAAVAERARGDHAVAARETKRLSRLVPGPATGECDAVRDDGDTPHRTGAEERDLLTRLLEQAEEERDRAVRERGLLALRVHAAHLAPDPIEDDAVSATFADLLADARDRYPLLEINADPEIAALLEAYPKAAAWRRKPPTRWRRWRRWQRMHKPNGRPTPRAATRSSHRRPVTSRWERSLLKRLLVSATLVAAAFIAPAAVGPVHASTVTAAASASAGSSCCCGTSMSAAGAVRNVFGVLAKPPLGKSPAMLSSSLGCCGQQRAVKWWSATADEATF